MPQRRRTRIVAVLGIGQTLAWGASYYLPAVLAAPMARDTGVSTPTVFLAFSLSLVVAAICGPAAGRAIDRFGGRATLMTTNLLLALALAVLAGAHEPVQLFIGWGLLGIGIASGLYEAAFATLVQLYGRDSRGAITGVTLIAGFASTVGWPLSAWMESRWGWRGACLGWIALQLVVALPLHATLPRAVRRDSRDSRAGDTDESRPGTPAPRRAVALLSFMFAAMLFISTAMASHLPTLLQAGGVSLATSIALGALIGPAQVIGRIAEFGVLRRAHPLLSARMSTLLHPLGAIVFALGGGPAAGAFAVLHGVGNGILTIAKGTLPLVLFGPSGYGRLQGVLTLPARIAQAAAPWLFGLAIARYGVGALWLSSGLGVASFAALLGLPHALREPSDERRAALQKVGPGADATPAGDARLMTSDPTEGRP